MILYTDLITKVLYPIIRPSDDTLQHKESDNNTLKHVRLGSYYQLL